MLRTDRTFSVRLRSTLYFTTLLRKNLDRTVWMLCKCNVVKYNVERNRIEKTLNVEEIEVFVTSMKDLRKQFPKILDEASIVFSNSRLDGFIQKR